MEYPNFAILNAASDEEICSFLKAHRYRRGDYIQRLISKIRNHVQFISPDVEYAYQFELRYLCQILMVINEEMERIETEMKLITDAHRLGLIFKSLPGAGNVLACKLLAIFGDNKNRFDSYNGVQCLFGTAPRNYQSGVYHKVIMRKACNKSARAILYRYAFASLQFSTWAREYYDVQRSRGKTHSVAVRALSNKWVIVIYKLWKNELLYNEALKKGMAA